MPDEELSTTARPFRVLDIHRIGVERDDRIWQYWYPDLDPTDDSIVLEPGENVLLTGEAKIRSLWHDGTKWQTDWVIPDAAVFTVTDRRLVFACRSFVTARVPLRIGKGNAPIIAGRSSSKATNKARARRAWSGYIASGQVRLAWLTNVILDCPKGLGTSGDTTLMLTTEFHGHLYRITLTKTNPELRRADVDEIAAAAAGWRIGRLTAEQLATTDGTKLEQQRHQAAGEARAGASPNRMQVVWTLPFPVWRGDVPPPFTFKQTPRRRVSRFWRLYAALAVAGWLYDAFGIHTIDYPLSWTLLAFTAYVYYVYRGGRWTMM
jgi:hypothetical protein